MSFIGRPRKASRTGLVACAAIAVLVSLVAAPPVPGVADTPAAAASPARTATLAATGLTYTDSRHARTNYEGRTTIRVSKARYTGYLAFPAVALDPDETITSASLTLRVTKTNKAARKGGGILVRPVAATWTAAGLTARTAPGLLAAAVAPAARTRAGHTVRIDFSAAEAAAYLTGGAALRLRHSRSGAAVRIARNGVAAPVLTITIAAAVPASGPTSTPPAASPFSVAVLPDTQQETMYASNPKFANRTKWLVDNAKVLNLAYVLHTGDVANWGWLVPLQFGVATRAIKNLDDAGIPYALTIGNHDTAAVGWNGKKGSTGYGGSAYAYNPQCKTRLSVAECRTRLLVRKTAAFNKAFPLAGVRNLGGAFEKGKVDNIWTTFEASGTSWLVLTLELWPRTQVVDWAARVVAAHPSRNVIVQTHSYLTAGGAIVQDKGGYGSTTGQYLFDHLVKRYANIKMVFSGHTGTAAKRVDTGVNGNRIVSYLQAFHSNKTNPVRIVTVDPGAGLVTTRIVAPYTNETWTQYATSDTISLVR